MEVDPDLETVETWNPMAFAVKADSASDKFRRIRDWIESWIDPVTGSFSPVNPFSHE